MNLIPSNRRILLRKWRTALFAVTCQITLFLPLSVAAHPEIEAQVEIVTKQIEREPGNAALFIKRGQLHHTHRDWERALRDFDRAAELDPNAHIVHLRRGETLLEAGRPGDTKQALDKFLGFNGDHAAANVLRARALVQLGAVDEAIADLNSAIERSARPKPDWYLERARLSATQVERIDEALRGLDEGLARLGALVTLETLAIDLELRRGRHDAAVARIDKLVSRMPRKEHWLVQRAGVLADAGRVSEARDSLSAALTAINTLPASRRRTKAVLDLEAQARASLAKLEESQR
jgi:predicted Zn-dependent protease